MQSHQKTLNVSQSCSDEKLIYKTSDPVREDMEIKNSTRRFSNCLFSHKNLNLALS